MTRIIIRAVPDRLEFIKYLKRVLPSAEWCLDDKYNDKTLSGNIKSTRTFLKGLAMSNDEPCIHMEEDVIITEDFINKAEKAIALHPNSIIQFFSMRKADLTIGSRWDGNFMMNQCFYLPKGYGSLITEYWNQWAKRDRWPGGYDMMMGDFLKSRKEKYFIHCPSLVQHRVAKSVADPKRSSMRQSLSFVNPVL